MVPGVLDSSLIGPGVFGNNSVIGAFAMRTDSFILCWRAVDEDVLSTAEMQRQPDTSVEGALTAVLGIRNFRVHLLV